MSKPDALPKITRRALLKTGAALVIGFYWSDDVLGDVRVASPLNPFDAWIRIDSGGTVTLVVAKSEMGQGVMTSLAMILADELEVDWKAVRVEHAETKPQIYDLGTSGSSSIIKSYLPLRHVGATARHMLVAAAAEAWGVSPAACTAQRGTVIHPGRTHVSRYQDLIERASQLPVPEAAQVRLKNPQEFRYVGQSIRRLDVPPKVDGSARFGIDTQVAGMTHAVIARCPVFGGRLKRADTTAARALPGVRDIVEIAPVGPECYSSGGVAVVADNVWTAMKARRLLNIEWDDGPAAGESSETLRRQLQSLVQTPGRSIRAHGDVDAAMATEARTIEASYELPFLAHATMEPMNCVADVRSDRVEIWAPTQSPDWSQRVVADVTGVPLEAVNVHTTLMGGGFGRRDATDFAAEAAQVSRAVGAPVKVVWTREDDMQHDFYRPAFQHLLTAGIDKAGRIIFWRHRIASTPIATFWRADAKPEQNEIGGAALPPYTMESFRIEYAAAASGMRRSWWRSVEESSSAFAIESFVDELAAASRTDPLEFRLRSMGHPRTIENGPSPDTSPALSLDTKRLAAVLRLAADKARWGTPTIDGRKRGLALFYSFNTYVAQVAEVSVADGRVRVHRVTCVVDCGRAINPDGVKAQMEGGIVFGLSALWGEITTASGRPQQSNFADYPVLRMRDAPVIDVHVMPSHEQPTGVGEPGVPPVAPAVVNAIFAATGKRIRRLPIRQSDLL